MIASRRFLVVSALMLVLALVPLAAALVHDPFWITLATRVVITAIAVVSLDLLMGYAGLASFGHAAFFGLGGYAAALLASRAGAAPPGSWLHLVGGEAALAWPLAMVSSGLFGLVIGALALRTRGIHFIMITLAFSQMLYFLLVSFPALGGDEGLRMDDRQRLFGFDIADPTVFYYVAFTALVLTLLAADRIVRSRFGSVLIGCSQNERRMKFLGYRTTLYLLAVFAVSAAGSGLAGALMASDLRYAGPQMLSWFQSGELMVMVILGGMATLYGGILGAAAFLLVQEFLIGLTEHWEAILGAVLLALVLASPGGIYGLLAGARRPYG